jgi:exopolysaccharide biosynthesis polyprenyl glycosylphosphotransferase
MEPDILATPSAPRSDAADPGLISGSPVTLIDREPLSHASLFAMSEAVTRLPDGSLSFNGHAHGEAHANGHSHGNGNGHTANGHVAGDWTLRMHTAMPPVTGYTAAAALPHVTPAENGPYLRWGKRAIDLLGAMVALVVLSPLMLLIALMVKLESRGPVFYRSSRIGKNGRSFTFLKFRSMVDGADRHRKQLTHLNEVDGPVFKISRDPRVTRIGRLLRISSIDEIPQFLNVLNGDMSLVGPRPPIPEEVEQYEPWQLRRLDVKPGITCLWQISGRSTLSFREWMRLDLEYIKHRSFWLDLRILLRTIPAVLSREGAY